MATTASVGDRIRIVGISTDDWDFSSDQTPEDLIGVEATIVSVHDFIFATDIALTHDGAEYAKLCVFLSEFDLV